MSPRRPSNMDAGIVCAHSGTGRSRATPATIFEGRLGDMVVYFVDCPQLYDREGMYGFGDDDARSVYFSRAVLEMLPALQFSPDVIQIHDWYAALVPNLIDRIYTDGPISEVATALTIHN